MNPQLIMRAKRGPHGHRQGNSSDRNRDRRGAAPNWLVVQDLPRRFSASGKGEGEPRPLLRLVAAGVAMTGEARNSGTPTSSGL